MLSTLPNVSLHKNHTVRRRDKTGNSQDEDEKQRNDNLLYLSYYVDLIDDFDFVFVFLDSLLIFPTDLLSATILSASIDRSIKIASVILCIVYVGAREILPLDIRD